ncbi:MAG: hypothetical protein CL610_00080 [Anaerolineaceae bacterium]|nr:hypothetical protein [Anaerolineaceae bacterium]
MNKPIYLFDTNVISALVRTRDARLAQRIASVQPQHLLLPEPVIHEIERGLLYRGASRQIDHFREIVAPQFYTIPVQFADWRAAAALWAYTKKQGHQFSDVDLLLGAMTIRLDGILITNDRDFDHLPMVPTENWPHQP